MADYKVYVDQQTGIERIEYFDEHWYKIGDVWLPSVSKVINDIITKGYGYDKWLKDTGNEAGYVLREAQASGSSLHHAIEALIKGGLINAEYEQGSYTKKEWQKLNNWYNWYNNFDFEPIATELIVYDIDLGVAGTMDFVVKKDDEIWIMDWKTGNNIYDTSELQLAAYASMYNKSHEEKITRAGIIHVGALNKTFKDMNGPGIKCQEINIEDLTLQFKKTLDLFKWRFPNAKAPIVEFPLSLKLDKGLLKATDSPQSVAT